MKSRFKTELYETTDADGNTQRLPDLGGSETDSDVKYSICGDNVSGPDVMVAVGTVDVATMDAIRNTTATTELTDAEASDLRAEWYGNSLLENTDITDPEIDAALDAHPIEAVVTTDEMNSITIALGHQTVGRDTMRDIEAEYGATSRAMLIHLKTTPEDRANIVQDYGLPFPDHFTPSKAARASVQAPTVGWRSLQDQELSAVNKLAKAESRDGSADLPQNTREDMDGEMSERTYRILMGHVTEHQELAEYAHGRVSTPPWSDEPEPGRGDPSTRSGPLP